MLVYSLTRMKEHGMMERIGILVNKRERERDIVSKCIEDIVDILIQQRERQKERDSVQFDKRERESVIWKRIEEAKRVNAMLSKGQQSLLLDKVG